MRALSRAQLCSAWQCLLLPQIAWLLVHFMLEKLCDCVHKQPWGKPRFPVSNSLPSSCPNSFYLLVWTSEPVVLRAYPWPWEKHPVPASWAPPEERENYKKKYKKEKERQKTAVTRCHNPLNPGESEKYTLPLVTEMLLSRAASSYSEVGPSGRAVQPHQLWPLWGNLSWGISFCIGLDLFHIWPLISVLHICSCKMEQFLFFLNFL